MVGGMEGVGYVPSAYRTLRRQPPRDRSVARVAAGQHTVISLDQLRALGLTASAVRSRVTSGRLHPIHRGVYAVGHGRLTREGRWMAAVLACGPEAVLSHRSAAALWGIRPDNRAKIDVSVPSRSVRSRPGIDVHRSLTLVPADRTRVDGMPCTTLARTLLDLAEVVNGRGLERAIEQAEVLRLFDLRAVEDVLARANGRRGAGVLRSVLAAMEEPALTDTDLEERFLTLCRAARLPRPEVNEWLVIDDLPAIKADFLWRAERLVIETDGWESHGTRRAFEHDRRRDERLKLAGYEPLRFTWRRIIREPNGVMRTVAELLARRAAGGAR
jgi:very-short-patch-repair endonuclease